MTRTRKITATYQGVTGTRHSHREYTHAVFGYSLADTRAAYYEDYLAKNSLPEEVRTRFESYVGEARAKGDYWLSVSWHQGPANAAKGLVAAQKKGGKYGKTFARVVLVLVNPQE